MNCKEIKESLEEYIFGELNEEVSKVVEEHIENCAACKIEYDDLKESISLIRTEFDKIDVPEELASVRVQSQSRFSKLFLNKKIISVAACIVMIFLLAITTTRFLPDQNVNAGDYRNGFSLLPEDSDETGVSTDSSYVLKSIKKLDENEIKGLLAIDGEAEPNITKKDSNTFIIKPKNELQQNKLYTFRIKSEENQGNNSNAKNDIEWTFQTRAAFKVLSAFPGDKTTEVPTNSGIEIYFSHENFDDIDNYFEITPAVKGRFETHKRSLVFVPKELKEDTLYTVKVKKGLKLKGTKYFIDQDYVFQFETGGKNEGNIYDRGMFNFNNIINEYSPDEKPYIPINYFINQETYKSKVEVDTSVYSYNSADEFVSNLKKKNSMPNWAYRSVGKNSIPTDGLNKVYSFKQEFSKAPNGEQFIKLPDSLPIGFYLIDSKWEDNKFQTFIQVTNLGMYLMKTKNKSLLWLNDLKTGKPVTAAEIKLVDGDKKFNPDSNGIVYFDSINDDISKDQSQKMNVNAWSQQNKYFIITTNDKKSTVLCYSGTNNYYAPYNTSSMYWNFLQLDRSLYKPDDVVNFWGLVKNRYEEENISEIKAEIINENIGVVYRLIEDFRSNYPFMDNQALVSEKITVEDGVFKGSIKLPMLDPGGYTIKIKNGNETIASAYINVQNYVKPPYKIEITKDKEAIFPGQNVSFKLKSSFFEGTGVPDLSMNYDIGSYSIGENGVNNSCTTDKNGEAVVNYLPKPDSVVQGEQFVPINVRATLPEVGETTTNDGVRVFINDINVDLKGEQKGNKGSIKAQVNKIVLDKINNKTAKDSNDYIGDAINEKELDVTIYKNTWDKVEDGEYYDYINKVTQKRYRYVSRKDVVKTFKMTTDTYGKAYNEFELANVTEGYYSADVKCIDGNGRDMKFEVYVGTFFDINSYDDNRYFLDGGKEKYFMNDPVKLTYKKGKNSMPDGKYLFIKTQNGIREYIVKDGPDYSFNFNEKDVPNVQVTGVYFNGITYVESEQFNAVFDYKEKNLIIEAKTDKKSYKPGDEVIMEITAKNKSGEPKKAVVNVSLVDEALYKLQEQEIDTITSLYSGLDSGIELSYRSHTNSNAGVLNGSVNRGIQVVYSEPAQMKAEQENGAWNSKAHLAVSGSVVNVKFDTASVADFSGYSAKILIRQDFRDAAYFTNITLDDNGHGTVKFKLPDNITSWRVTMSGVTTDLSAGSGKVGLDVSLPFFINYTLSSNYLVGDKPVLGVNAYGNSLAGGETVTFEVRSITNPDKVLKAQGKAFERVNIPLWKMTEGIEEIVITAESQNGLKDSIKNTITVVNSYHQIEKAEYYDLKPDMKINGGKTGNTKLVFADKSKGAFLPELTSLLYTNGNRVDQKLSGKIAADIINKYYSSSYYQGFDSSIKVSDYQRQDGGISVLPYGNSDADITAKLTSLIKDDVNAQKLKKYFYNILLNDSPGLKGNALYGLAVLKEPILLDLDSAAKVENASVKDLLFIALAYCELGEMPKAALLYNTSIANKIEEYKPFFRINVGKDNDDVLECTSLAAVLASKLDKPEKKGLYDYCSWNSTKDLLINIEKLLYIKSEINKYNDETIKFKYTYDGETKDISLADGQSYAITLPSTKLKYFKIDSVEGDISLVSVYNSEIVGLQKVNNSLKIKREYSVNGISTNRFKEGDLIKVTLDWDIAKKAIDGEYEITDYLPSGLKPIENTYNMGVDFSISPFRRVDGQKVTFYVGKDWIEKKPLVYYARIVSPGDYNAQAPIIQSCKSKDYINVGNSDKVEIQYNIGAAGE